MCIKCVIVEDEPQSAERLSRLLTKFHSSSVEVVGVVDSVDGFVSVCADKRPDLVFLDVQIKDVDAFQLLEKLDRIDFEIIFTTGHTEFAATAFRWNALDYLLKPIDRFELGEALGRYKAKVRQIGTASSGLQVVEQLKLLAGVKKIPVSTLNGIELISVNEIIRCEADVNYTHLFLRDKSRLTVSKTLKAFEIMLGKLGFLRVHNSHLVNIREIKSYQKGKGGTLIMNDLAEVEVSVRKKEEVLNALKSL